MFTIEGKHTTAKVFLDEDAIEEGTRDQIQSMVDHEAFRNPVAIMPDCHVGAGAVIGFTMPLGNRVVPNVVGVDKSCGMTALNIGDELEQTGEELDQAVRDRVPMGWGQEGLRAPNRDYYHVKNDFPWDEANETLANFVDAMDADYIPEMAEFLDEGGYDIDYFKELCEERAGRMSHHFDVDAGISSVGTLGSGNHFVELGKSVETGDYWVVVHSGSRGLGNNSAEYWQEQATEYINEKHDRTDDRPERIREALADFPDHYVKFDPETVGDDDLLDWVQGGQGEDFVNYEEIPKVERERIGTELKNAVLPIANEEYDPGEPLDYLEGDLAAGYLIDLIFCHHYATESRRVMAEAVADEAAGGTVKDKIVSTHNFIDFTDGVIRKGATRAHEGDRLVIPFNMKQGTLICEGKGNPEWNKSAPHGAGRVMSRGEAKRTFTEDELKAEMEGIHTSAIPLDEAPGAYKDPSLIEDAIKPTATIIDRLEVIHNWKAAN